jgi:hypothetical protein
MKNIFKVVLCTIAFLAYTAINTHSVAEPVQKGGVQEQTIGILPGSPETFTIQVVELLPYCSLEENQSVQLPFLVPSLAIGYRTDLVKPPALSYQTYKGIYRPPARSWC